MHEILARLPERARVLDLGCDAGSFDAPGLRTVRADLDWRAVPGFVQADAARLPFGSGVFDAVVCNHSLEHFERLDDALREIGRVVKPDGALFVAVPDAGTLCDRLYRWLASGGGHVNAFRSAPELAARIVGATGLAHRATRTLCTSLSFLNRADSPRPIPKKLWLLGGGREAVLVWWSAVARWTDRRFGTRLAVYGWAFYFGDIPAIIDTKAASNVCARCGSGHPSDWLLASGRVAGRWWNCPACKARNRFTRDEWFRY